MISNVECFSLKIRANQEFDLHLTEVRIHTFLSFIEIGSKLLPTKLLVFICFVFFFFFIWCVSSVKFLFIQIYTSSFFFSFLSLLLFVCQGLPSSRNSFTAKSVWITQREIVLLLESKYLFRFNIFTFILIFNIQTLFSLFSFLVFYVCFFNSTQGWQTFFRHFKPRLLTQN